MQNFVAAGFTTKNASNPSVANENSPTCHPKTPSQTVFISYD